MEKTPGPEHTPELAPKDSVEVSLEAKLLHMISELPDIRADKVSHARYQIEHGTYESEAKLDLAIERLIGDLNRMRPA